jgi:murein DD-endopeptidase MepM/ murein hydrolase activator NlpD
MRDYKSTFGQPKKSRFRFFKLPLLTTALIAGAFYWLSQEPVNEVTQQTTTLQPLSLPGQEQVTPESLIIPKKPELITGKPAEPVVSEPVVEKPEKPGEEITEAEKPAEAIAEMSATWESHVIESGDTLAEIFKNWSLSASLLHKIVNSSKLAKSLADIHPGETIKLLRDDNSELLELAVERSPTETLLISRSEQGFDSEIITRKVDVRQAFASGTIDSSLFVDGQKSGLTDAQIMEMAGIFGWDIDFALELRKGDSFKLLYEEHYLDGEKYRNGPILAAEFENDGKLFKAVRYTSPDGTSSYYDPDDGRNKKKAFIRTPVKFARISSGFSNNRYHPKLKKWRAHRGVDYAAPTGTPIKAAGKGKVIFRGTKGGYGKTVILQHGSRYTTLYGHLSKYANAAKQGKSVAQGQIIGYVGQTGLATGPHLHYEFRVDGVHRNPLTVTLPKADPIDSKYRADFDRVAKQLMAQFKTFDSNTSQQIAQAPASSSDG